LLSLAGCPAAPEGGGSGSSAGSGADGASGSSGSKGGSGGSDSHAGAGGGSGSWSVDNPDGVAPDGGTEIVDVGHGGGDGEDAPSCGASRVEAQQVVVEQVVQVPIEVTEEVTEEVPEEVTEEVTEQVTTQKPTVLYVMFDKSMSMAGPPFGAANIWPAAVSAIKSFVNDSKSAGLSVALQYFPLSGSNGGNCSNGSGYSTPAVPVGKLPGAAAAISTSLDQHSANGTGTPIEGALRGATEFCKSYQASHAGEQCIAVLVTDGKPENSSGCSESTTTLAGIAKSAHDAGVTTYTVGLSGADFSVLDEIAKKGGAADCDATAHFACDVSQNASGLVDALNKIRETVSYETHTETHTVTHTVTKQVTHTETVTKTVEQVQKMPVPCEWSIPASTEGSQFDKNLVNIRYSSGDDKTTFVHVGSKDACIESAWYYDDESAPSRLIACEQTCEEITSDDDAQIDILLGCPTLGPG
jgi:hypothetical protein